MFSKKVRSDFRFFIKIEMYVLIVCSILGLFTKLVPIFQNFDENLNPSYSVNFAFFVKIKEFRDRLCFTLKIGEN